MSGRATMRVPSNNAVPESQRSPGASPRLTDGMPRKETLKAKQEDRGGRKSKREDPKMTQQQLQQAVASPSPTLVAETGAPKSVSKKERFTTNNPWAPGAAPE